MRRGVFAAFMRRVYLCTQRSDSQKETRTTKAAVRATC